MSTLAVHPGVERWAQKIGTDNLSSAVGRQSQTATIAELAALPAPTDPLDRVPPVEETIYTVSATLTFAKEEADGDYHLVLSDDAGNTLIAEIPDPDFVPASSPFQAQIAKARTTAGAALGPLAYPLTGCQDAVTVTGVGFFDRLHGQDGVAPNGIELHPVLSIQFIGDA